MLTVNYLEVLFPRPHWFLVTFQHHPPGSRAQGLGKSWQWCMRAATGNASDLCVPTSDYMPLLLVHMFPATSDSGHLRELWLLELQVHAPQAWDLPSCCDKALSEDIGVSTPTCIISCSHNLRTMSRKFATFLKCDLETCSSTPT